MNKNVKKIITFALVLSTAAAVAPIANIELLTTRVYAATTNTTEILSSLKLETSGGSNIKLYDDNDYSSSNKVDSSKVTKGSTYYAETKYKTVSINADGPSSSYIKVFKGTSSSTKGKSLSSDITIDGSSTTTLVIRVYSEAPASNVRYDEKDKVLSEYKIKVKCTSDSDNSSTDASEYDDIYLDKLSVDGGNISLSESRVSYTYSVSNDVSSVSIKAEPNSSSDVVTINGSEVDENDRYKRTVSLDTGENEIKIEIEDEDDNNRIYNLKITRAGTNVSNGSLSNTNYDKNQWVQVNGEWQYIDETGASKKNVFFTDPVNGKTYYLQYNGLMATNWKKIGGIWYYFGVNGAAQAGWVKTNEKWYYLYSDGSMAVNTQIGQYIVGSDGAWIQ